MPNPHLYKTQLPANLHIQYEAGCEEATTSMEQPQRTGLPQIVKLDVASKLAEKWVNDMTRIEEVAPAEVESEGRPPRFVVFFTLFTISVLCHFKLFLCFRRLGLGAKVARKTKYTPSDDPVEKKLHAKLEAEKRKAARSIEESNPSIRNLCDADDESDEDLESRTNAFAKKRSAPPTASVQTKKKQK
ncbi:hypothetical protein HS088_TW18G00420 [Tripterygium wilfordii]|uniref:Uncharacterized protein n=1 Tax=Tripterygium wilfordii TaxID=458696 RepID=A0A7J7CCS1_TRIWF|nr:hypothetical protein HS088_TW18G00420 [Tripterygium wilfordii]